MSKHLSKVLLLPLFYKWMDGGPESSSKWPKVTKESLDLNASTLTLESTCLTITPYCFPMIPLWAIPTDNRKALTRLCTCSTWGTVLGTWSPFPRATRWGRQYDCTEEKQLYSFNLRLNLPAGKGGPRCEDLALKPILITELNHFLKNGQI